MATARDVPLEAILTESVEQYERQQDATYPTKPSETPPTPQPNTSQQTEIHKVDVNDLYFHKLIADNVIDMVCLHDPEGNLLYVSPSAKSITGFDVNEVLGKNPYEFFHPDDLDVIRASHNASLEGTKINSVIYRHRRRDGSYVWLDTLTTPIVDDNGQVVNLITVSRDIGERVANQKKLAEERDLFKTLMETSPSGIMVVDTSGQIIFSNQRADEITGMTDDKKSTDRTYDSAEWKHTDYDGNPWLDEQQPFVRVIETRKPVWDVRHAIEWSNGRIVYLSINGMPILDENGEVDKVIFTIEDYTERKLQQDAIEEALEREKQLNRLKSNFISMVSHEFRTPLTVIMTSTEILRHKCSLFTPEQLETRLDKITRQIVHLSNLLGEVTFINKSDLMGMEVQHRGINLPDFLEQIVDEIQSAYPSHNLIDVSLTVMHPNLMMDESLLQKIVVNLLTNAMKYSPLESTVKLTCKADSQQLSLIVKDEGIGIPPTDQVELFSEFHRGRNVGTISGTGLGLAIVKRAVVALGGDIHFESSENTGTTFYVTLPIETNLTIDD